MIKNTKNVFLAVIVLLSIVSCEHVEDGYRPHYPESTANFHVDRLSPDRGAIGEAVSFSLMVSSASPIRSLVVFSNISGADGTGFIVDSTMKDPLVDHVFGTIQPGTTELNMQYKYVIPVDTADVTITFRMIDGEGKKESVQKIFSVPSVVKYDSIVLYTQSFSKADGFATVNGNVFRNLPDYEAVNTVNEAVQGSLDIVFLVKGGAAMLVAPYNGNLISNMSIRNKTLFKRLEGMDSKSFDNLTNASLSLIVEENNVAKGTTYLEHVKVGDIIGFRTDFASSNPYHFGILRVNAIHPASVSFYEGMSYLIEMDIVTQK